MTKTQKKGPAFLLKTFEMLEKAQFRQFIDWNLEGNGFVVKNPSQVAQRVLPMYFRHGNMHSFIRQLNMYGFTKRRRETVIQMQRKVEKKGNHKDSSVVNKQSQQMKSQDALEAQQQHSQQQRSQISIKLYDGSSVSQEEHEENSKHNNTCNKSLLKNTHRQPQPQPHISSFCCQQQISQQQHNNSKNTKNTIKNTKKYPNTTTTHLDLQTQQNFKKIVDLMILNKTLIVEQIYHLNHLSNNNLEVLRDTQNTTTTTMLQQKMNNHKSNPKKETLDIMYFNQCKKNYLQSHLYIWQTLQKAIRKLEFKQQQHEESNQQKQNIYQKATNNNNNNISNNNSKKQLRDTQVQICHGISSNNKLLCINNQNNSNKHQSSNHKKINQKQSSSLSRIQSTSHKKQQLQLKIQEQ